MAEAVIQITTGRDVWLGTDVDYHEAWELQRELVTERAERRGPDTLLLLEHAPVYTAGRRTLAEHVLGELQAPLVETDRGGQLTYHGPGQLVAYPIIGLADKGMGPKSYVRALEAAVVDTLRSHGVSANTEEGLTGVWTKRGKIAAIGVRISRGVSMHGLALNVTTDLSAYDRIVACGIDDRPTTSMAQTGPPMAKPLVMRDVAAMLTSSLGRHLGIAWQSAGPAVLP